jgi:deoxyribonuclease IV
MRIGIHVRGFDSGKPVAVERARERGAETIQIFASNPRQWRLPAIKPEADEELRRQMAEDDVSPLFLHAPYLVNLASPAPATAEASFRTVEWTLMRGAALGAAGVVVHAGQCVGGERSAALIQSAKAICRLMDAAPRGPRLLLELTSGGKGAVASRLDDVGELLDACDRHERLGICVDTCHLYAAGYDLAASSGLEELVAGFEQIGVDRLGLIHTNDSRDPLGSRRDRHWHVGEGEIGVEGFRMLVSHPAFERFPLICETPGDVEEDRRNIGLLKRLRDDATGGAGKNTPSGAHWLEN